MTDPSSLEPLAFRLDRTAGASLADQIAATLRQGIRSGILAPGTRLPSGRALAAQLNLARGTIKTAYEALRDERLIFGAGAGGTFVAAQRTAPPPAQVTAVFDHPLGSVASSYSSRPLPFEMGSPAHDAFPAKVWARLRTQAVRRDAMAYTTYADPSGEPGLRNEIARQLSISRGVQCVADQVFVTGGYRHSLSLVVAALRAHGGTAVMEEPGFPIGRRALELSNMSVVGVPIDEEGLRVDRLIERAPDAMFALVTPGQQAPYGITMSARRRQLLVDWAQARRSWILEDDYLSDLQLDGRAYPALAALPSNDRTILLGTFSKTMSPTLGLGFVLAPPAMISRILEVATILAPAPNRTTQLALADFMADGHYLRHLRHMKQLYRSRRDRIVEMLAPIALEPGMAGLALRLRLPADVDDVELAARAAGRGILPAALSPWFADSNAQAKGLLLGVANVDERACRTACDALRALLEEQDLVR